MHASIGRVYSTSLNVITLLSITFFHNENRFSHFSLPFVLVAVLLLLNYNYRLFNSVIQITVSKAFLIVYLVRYRVSIRISCEFAQSRCTKSSQQTIEFSAIKKTSRGRDVKFATPSQKYCL